MGVAVDFASHLQCDETHQADPSFYLKALPLVSAELPVAERGKLDKQGVALWNTCNKLKGSGVINQEWLCRTRAFAFLLLESADDTNSSPPSGHARAIKNALKTVRECLNAELLDLAQRVLEIAAGRHESLIFNPAYENPGDHKQYAPLSLEFYSLRLALAWRQGRLDLAEHFYTKINTFELQRCGMATENLFDLLFEIAKQHLNHKRQEAAVIWLARAQKLFDTVDLADLSPDASDLRMIVLHTYAQALMSVNEPEAELKAHEVLEVLQRDYGGNLAVMLLHLEMNFRRPDPNAEACYTSLSATSRSAHLTESNFEMMLHYAHKLHRYDERLALNLLEDFLVQRLAIHSNEGWIERALLTWLSMGLKTASVPVDGQPAGPMVTAANAQHFLTVLHQSWGRTLDAEAAQAALVLLWRRIEIAADDQRSESTSEWCQVALHSMFGRAGYPNIGKIQRKLVQYHLKRSDAAAAREVLSQMAGETQSHYLSRYLLYCTAIRLGNEGLASTALNLVESSESSSQLLYACVSETQRLGSRKQGIRVLRKLLDRYVHALIPEANLGALLRCLIHLLMDELKEPDCDVVQVSTQMSEVFGITKNQIFKQLTSAKNDETKEHVGPLLISEIDWLSKTANRLVFRRFKEWPRTVILDILDHCFDIGTALCARGPFGNLPNQQILTTYPTGLQRSVTNIFFVSSLIRTAIAREAASVSPMAASYEEVRKSIRCHAEAYTNLVREQDKVDEDLLEDIRSQFRRQRLTLIPLELEAVLMLQQKLRGKVKEHMQDSAPENALALSLEAAHALGAPAETYALLADMVLSAVSGSGGEKPTEPSITVELGSQLVKQLIGAIRRTVSYDVGQASRWIRCLVQMVTDKRPGMSPDENKTQLIEGVVQQAVVLAHDTRRKAAASGATALTYPAEELEWLATTLFNLAVDLYIAESEESAKIWARKAVDVADVLGDGECGTGDGGLLAKVLRGKMAELRWQNPLNC